MSLKAWYPFNGDFINQGVGDLSLTQVTTPAYIDNGKFGKCLSEGAFKWSAAQTASILNNEEVSFSIWVYPSGDAGATSGCLFGTEGMTAPNNRKFTFFMYPTVNDLHWSWQNDADTTFASGVLTGVFPNKTWTHLAITYKNPDGKIYINGVLKTSFTGVSNSSSFAYETSVIANRANRYVSDFRIYDHCLSPKEVKELSKGLCLHYTLNNGGLGCPNLATNTYNNTSWSWSMQAGDYTKTYEEDAGGKWCVLTKGTATAQSGWSVLQWPYIGRSEYVANTKYTVSFEVIPSHNCTLSIRLLKSNGTDYLTDTKSQAVVANKVNKVEVTLTTVATLPTSTDQIIYITGHNSSNGAIYKFRKVKIEKGEKATAWCPNKADAQYEIFAPTVEYDTSGYRNNATPIDSTITHLYGSPRYDVYTKFDGNTSGLKIENTAQISPVLNNGIFTISFWVKHDVASNREIYFGNFDATADFNLERTAGNDLRFYWNASPDLTMSGTTISDANWHHVVVTRNGSAIKCYIDGVSKYSGTATIASLTFDGSFRLGRDTRTGGTAFGGGMSDFRLYATALSDSDILELYNAPIAVDNGAAIYAMELKEVY